MKPIILLMCCMLGFLTLRLIFSSETRVFLMLHSGNGIFEEEAVAAGSSAKLSYQGLYPDLYVSSVEIPTTLEKDKKIVYLTFDDGPSPRTDMVLDILKEKNIKATFFVMGCGVGDVGKKRLNRIVDEGHTIGIHTFSHDYNKIYQSVPGFLDDFSEVYQLVEEATGFKPNIFRFPGGSNNIYIKKIKKDLVAEMERRGFTYYDWNVSAEDAVGKPSKASVKKNLEKAFQFSYPVLLMHDADYNSIITELLPGMIDELKNKGYEFKTLENRVPIQF